MLINEFLPNPVGKDADGEFIELFNNSQETVSLTGWKLKDASGKTFTLSAQGGSATGGKNQTVQAGEYLTLNYKTTKISLNNDGETLFLYDSNGVLADKAEFSGNALAGKSLVRQNNQFIFTDTPTPDKANVFNETDATKTNLPNNLSANALVNTSANQQIINGGAFHFSNLLIGLVVALALAFLSVIILKKINPSE